MSHAGSSSNSAYRGPIFAHYLRNLRDVMVNQENYPLIKVVLGNESCDLDSAACALAFAFLLHAETLEGSLLQGKVILPVLNVKREELRLKTEVVYLLGKFNIPLALIITRDDIDLAALHNQGRLELVLVDHHTLAQKDAELETSIVQIIDHRAQCRSWNIAKPLCTIIEVGSCASLVTEKIMDRRKDEKEILSENMEITNFLYGAILLDTMNFNPDAQRYKETDLRMVAHLEPFILATENSREEMYHELLNARTNVSTLTTYERLLKDQKLAEENPVCTLTMLVQEFMLRPDAVTALQELLASGPYEIVVLIGVTNQHEQIRRDLGFYSESSAELCSKVLNTLQNDLTLKLELDMIALVPEVPGLVVCNQGNLKLTRKHIKPVIEQVIRQWKQPVVTNLDDD